MSTPPSSFTRSTRSGFRTGVAVTIVIAGAVLSLFIFLNWPPATAVEEPTISPAIAGLTDVLVSVLVSDQDPQLGEDTAPVQIIEFGDFDCEFCREFHRTTFPEIVAKYIDTGIVQYVHKDFPLQQSVNQQSVAAAKAARCAGEQGMFWDYAAALYARDFIAEADFQDIATTLELDVARHSDCLTADTATEAVIRGVQDAVAAGVTATPSFVINGKLYEGALSFEEIASIIDTRMTQLP